MNGKSLTSGLYQYARGWGELCSRRLVAELAVVQVRMEVRTLCERARREPRAVQQLTWLASVDPWSVELCTMAAHEASSRLPCNKLPSISTCLEHTSRLSSPVLATPTRPISQSTRSAELGLMWLALRLTYAHECRGLSHPVRTYMLPLSLGLRLMGPPSLKASRHPSRPAAGANDKAVVRPEPMLPGALDTAPVDVQRRARESRKCE